MAQTADDYSTVLSVSEGVLDDVERALARLDEGTYGACEACGGPIDEGRLARFPTARTCAGHPQLTDPRVTPEGPVSEMSGPGTDGSSEPGSVESPETGPGGPAGW